LRVRQDPACATPRLRTLTLETDDGAHYTLDTGV
ncbi:hypothetical protein CKW47_12795, partial [Bordetella pertussis]